LGGGLATLAVLAFMIGAITATISPFVPTFIDVAPGIAHRLTICLLIVAFVNAVQLFGFAASGLLRAFQRTFVPGFFQVLSEVVALVSTAYLVVHGRGLYSIVVGLLARCAIETAGSGVAFGWLIWRHFGLRPRWERVEAIRLWRLSSYQFFTQIAGRLKSNLDSFLIGVMLGTDAGGGYALTIRAHETVRIFSSGVAGSLSPVMAHLHGEGNVDRLKDVALTLFKVQALIAAIGFGGVIAFNYAFMQLWVGPGIYSSNAVSIVAAVAGIVYLLSASPYEVNFARGGFSFLTKVMWFDVI
jgi:O-antigen/teichoic acid export membrane protein